MRRFLFAFALGVVALLAAPTAQAPLAQAQIRQLAAIPPAPSPAAPAPARRIRVAAGATLKGILVDAGIAAGEAQDAIDALKPLWDPRDLKPGQEITLRLASAGLQELRLPTAIDRDLVVARAGDGQFAAEARRHPLARVPELAAGVIRTSLSEAASDAGVPMPVLAAMIQAFSYDVDFQRDLQPDDSFEVLFERLYDENGRAVGIGDITYAAMTLSGRTLKLYRYQAPGTKLAAFFNQRGESVKKPLLKTPVDGAHLSSGYGMRLHPILGYTKMHRGVDFAAPKGTPIMAAGDGVVEQAGFSGAYGNLVVLHHTGAYETAYAHMSRIARGMKPGTPVHQGEVIGYVGATGRATGPHLHYELRIHGEPTNPMTMKAPPGAPLAGAALVGFRSAAQAVDHEVLALREATIVADTPLPRRAE